MPFGQLIKTTEAETISKKFDKDIKAFVFDLALIEAFLQDAKAKDSDAKYFVIIKATYNDPKDDTAVVTLAKSKNLIDFEVISNKNDEVPEHPGEDGKITFSNKPAEGVLPQFITLSIKK